MDNVTTTAYRMRNETVTYKSSNQQYIVAIIVAAYAYFAVLV